MSEVHVGGQVHAGGQALPPGSIRLAHVRANSGDKPVLWISPNGEIHFDFDHDPEVVKATFKHLAPEPGPKPAEPEPVVVHSDDGSITIKSSAVINLKAGTSFSSSGHVIRATPTTGDVICALLIEVSRLRKLTERLEWNVERLEADR